MLLLEERGQANTPAPATVGVRGRGGWTPLLLALVVVTRLRLWLLLVFGDGGQAEGLEGIGVQARLGHAPRVLRVDLFPA